MQRSTTPDQPPQAPPEPSGRELAVFERPGGRYGPDTELRVHLSEYQGHPFINLRVWTKGPDDGWYPTRKGCSVKMREARNLAATLIEAADLAEQGGLAPRGERRRPGPAPRRGRTDDRRQGGLPLAGVTATGEPEWQEDFDEFA